MICKNCKAKIPEESKYCEKCGLKIERDEIQVPHELIESTASQKNNNKTNFLLICKDREVKATTTAQTTAITTQDTTVETSNDEENDGDDNYAYEDDYLFPAVDEYISMINNSDIVRSGATYKISYFPDNSNSFNAYLKTGNVNIQTVTAESPKSEDDDNFGRITDVMVTTKDFAQTSDLDEKYAVLLCAAMTPIMPILAPNEPITYSQTIVDNRTRDFWISSSLHCYSGTENGISWIVIFKKTDGSILSACGETAVDYILKSLYNFTAGVEVKHAYKAPCNEQNGQRYIHA